MRFSTKLELDSYLQLHNLYIIENVHAYYEFNHNVPLHTDKGVSILRLVKICHNSTATDMVFYYDGEYTKIEYGDYILFDCQESHSMTKSDEGMIALDVFAVGEIDGNQK